MKLKVEPCQNYLAPLKRTSVLFRGAFCLVNQLKESDSMKIINSHSETVVCPPETRMLFGEISL